MRISSLEIITSTLLLACVSTLVADDPVKRTFELVALSPKFWTLIDHDAKLTAFSTGFGFTEGPVWDSSGYLRE